MVESKSDKFKRLAQMRGERILKDLRLLGNLSNRNNYEYGDAEVKALFTVIEEELRLAKLSFNKTRSRRIEFK